MAKINYTKIHKAIAATEEWVANAKNKEKFSNNGLTIYGCEVRNLGEYKEMLNYKDTREFSLRLLELYRAI